MSNLSCSPQVYFCLIRNSELKVVTLEKGRYMFDEQACCMFNRDWGFPDSKKELRFDFRKYCHVLYFVTKPIS